MQGSNNNPNGRLIHQLNKMRSKAKSYAFVGQHETGRNFMAVAKMIRTKHLKTLTQVNQELKRRNLEGK